MSAYIYRHTETTPEGFWLYTVGHDIIGGRLAYFWSSQQLDDLVEHFTKNPPRGAGRPRKA